MLVNLAAGTFVIALTVVIHTLGLIAVTRVMEFIVERFRWHGHKSRVIAMITVVMGLFAVMTIEIWVWAVAYHYTGAFGDFGTSLYFSTVAFSTLGFGDVIPDHDWRLFAALEGVNGFLLIGWSTAYLVSAGVRIGPFKSGKHF